MNTRSSYHGVSRRRFIATATAVTTFSISGLLHSGNLVAAAVADPKIDAMLAKAIEYLAQHQSPDGAFSPQSGVGVTALVTTGLLQNGRSPDDPLVARSLKFLEGFIQPDGGIYSPKLGYKNYETCIGLTCFVEANADKRYEKVIRNAETYLKATQWTEATNENDPDAEDRQVGSLLRRRRLWQEQAAGPFQHGLFDRCLEGSRQRPG